MPLGPGVSKVVSCRRNNRGSGGPPKPRESGCPQKREGSQYVGPPVSSCQLASALCILLDLLLVKEEPEVCIFLKIRAPHF